MVNVNDFSAEEPQMELLEAIFDRQSELMHKYHPIETESGVFNYQDGNIPVNLHTLAGQVRLKDFAWRTIEEIAEALEAHSILHGQEEIADGLHFFTELCILAGYNAEFFGTLDYLYNVAPVKLQQSTAVSVFVMDLGVTMNTLKNKPWKQSQMLTDITKFETSLRASMISYISVAKSFGITTPDELYDLYSRKSQVNKFRQRSGY